MDRDALQHTIIIHTKPVPKGRPRLGRRGRVFTPVRTLEAEAEIRDAWNGPMFAGPVELRVVFRADTIEVTVTAMSEDAPVSKLRGDLDNYIKTLMDGLNGAAWLDDKQVHGVWALKE